MRDRVRERVRERVRDRVRDRGRVCVGSHRSLAPSSDKAVGWEVITGWDRPSSVETGQGRCGPSQEKLNQIRPGT